MSRFSSSKHVAERKVVLFDRSSRHLPTLSLVLLALPLIQSFEERGFYRVVQYLKSYAFTKRLRGGNEDSFLGEESSFEQNDYLNSVSRDQDLGDRSPEGVFLFFFLSRCSSSSSYTAPVCSLVEPFQSPFTGRLFWSDQFLNPSRFYEPFDQPIKII